MVVGCPFIILGVWVFCLQVCLCTNLNSVLGSLKTVLDLPELELEL